VRLLGCVVPVLGAESMDFLFNRCDLTIGVGMLLWPVSF
jgi:hypothetical protein